MGIYLVTGGAGFIGSHLADALLKQGHQVVVADNLSTGRRENIPAGAQFIEVDLCHPDALDTLPNESYDGILHMAAQSSGAIGQKDPDFDCRTNTLATIKLAQWSLARDIPRFLYASTMTVYGQSNTEPLDEDAPCQPISYYGASKLASENYLRVSGMDGLNVTVFRLYSVYGSKQNLGNLYQGMVSIYLAYLLRGDSVPVTGSLDRYRDFVFVGDVVEAFLAALERPSSPSPLYNVGSGRRTTVRDLLDKLVNHMGLPPDHPIEEQAGSPNDVFGSVANIDRIGQELGWAPQTSLGEGLKKMIAWAIKQ